MMYRIGVDLGGTNIAAGLVDENYKRVCKKLWAYIFDFNCDTYSKCLRGEISVQKIRYRKKENIFLWNYSLKFEFYWNTDY